MNALTHEQTQELLGAYALDAVDADEAELVELHLRTCPRCRDEVAGHREVAALLAYGGTTAPEDLWQRIAAELEDATAKPVPSPALPAPWGRRHRWYRSPRQLLPMAAAVLLVLGLLGVVVRQQAQLDRVNDRLGRLGASADLSTAAAHAAVDPTASRISLESAGGRKVASAVVLPDGSGYLWPEVAELPALDQSHTYQLWAVAGGTKVSLGVLGNRPTVTAFRSPAPPQVAALALTAEKSPGVVASVNAPVALGYLPPETSSPTSTTP